MKVAVIGGRFDPVHIGHLIVAQDVYEFLSVDKLVFIPSFNPPHKPVVEKFKHRYNMLKIATVNVPYMEVSDIERELSLEKSYTYMVMEEFMKKHKFSKIYFVVGADQFSVFHTWYRYMDILNLLDVVVVSRKGYDKSTFPKECLNKVIIYEGRTIEVSSSEVRRRISEGKPFKFLVHEGVYDYIVRNKLYGYKYEEAQQSFK